MGRIAPPFDPESHWVSHLTSHPGTQLSFWWGVGGDYLKEARQPLSRLESGQAAEEKAFFSRRKKYSVQLRGSRNACHKEGVGPGEVPALCHWHLLFQHRGLNTDRQKLEGKKTWREYLVPAQDLCPASCSSRNSRKRVSFSLVHRRGAEMCLIKPSKN